jgi:MinD-like ATPase involved in chromosome partitioning or flagellar assembly
MVERLKEAIEKARQARALQAAQGEAQPGGQTGAQSGTPPGEGGRAAISRLPDLWDAIPAVAVDPGRLARERIAAAERSDPVHATFDVLRTRLLKLCAEAGWTRIAVTSPTKGCGKSLVSLNLAYSLARNTDLRTVLVDLDLRAPSLAQTLGLTPPHEIGDYLAGRAALEDTAVRIAPGLVAVLGRRRVPDSAELLLSQQGLRAAGAIGQLLQPTVMLFDLPPMLGIDDVQATLPLVDAVLLVAGGGTTTAAELAECEQLLEKGPPLAGVVLNRAETSESEVYYPEEAAG